MKTIIIVASIICIALGSVCTRACLANTESNNSAVNNFQKFSDEVVAFSKSKDIAQKKKHYENAIQLMDKGDTEVRFYELNEAAKIAVECEDYQNAQQYANELLKKAPSFSKDWNYGNAIHDGNMVLGRIALRNGNKDAAADYLLKAGKTPGSPQLNSFGPNMSLAKDLLIAKDVQPVIKYFDLCRKFWSGNDGILDAWTKQAQQGKTPDFGANLLY